MLKPSLGIIGAAVGVFAALEILMAFTHPLGALPVATLERGEVFNALRGIDKELAKDRQTPYLAVMGSSLVAVQDTTQLNRLNSSPNQAMSLKHLGKCLCQLKRNSIWHLGVSLLFGEAEMTSNATVVW